jgi:cytochrome d ubiquinol oxidase subunit I
LISIDKAVNEIETRMPLLSTILHDLLQIVTAALGSPLGREVAPREFGAVVASWLSDRTGLSAEYRQIMVACGAGAGIHAWLLLRRGRNRFDEVAIGIALAVGGVAVLLQGASGDVLARMVAEKQPMKLASLEGQFKTESGAPLRIGGLPFPDERVTKYAIELPHGLSLLAFHRPNALIKGLDQEPQSNWPNVRAVHICFQIMVGCGSLLSLFALGAAWLAWRRGPLTVHTRFLKALILVSPLGFVALEAGWMVTELGRQPWIIYHLLRTRDAVTSMPNVSIMFDVMTALYVVLGIIVVWLLSRHVIAAPDTKQLERAETLV